MGGVASGVPLIGRPAADAMLNLLEMMSEQMILETCSLLQEKGTKAPFCINSLNVGEVLLPSVQKKQLTIDGQGGQVFSV